MWVGCIALWAVAAVAVGGPADEIPTLGGDKALTELLMLFMQPPGMGDPKVEAKLFQEDPEWVFEHVSFAGWRSVGSTPVYTSPRRHRGPCR